MAWRKGVILEPQLGPHLSPEELARRCDEHLKVLDAEQDAIYERIRERASGTAPDARERSARD